MDDKLTLEKLVRMGQDPAIKVVPRAQRPEFKISLSGGSFTNVEFIVDTDAEGYVQVGVRQNLRLEKLCRFAFGFDD